MEYGPTRGGNSPPQTVRTCDSNHSRSVVIRTGFIATASISPGDGLDETNTAVNDISLSH